jgi:hypothetical protein
MVRDKFKTLFWHLLKGAEVNRGESQVVNILTELGFGYLQKTRQKHYCFSQLAWPLQHNITYSKHTHFITHLLIATNYFMRISLPKYRNSH